MKTTLNAIRKHEPCKDGWEKLLAYLGKTKADDEPLAITTIIDSNGLQDALWCLRAVEGYDKEIRLFAVWCARQVQHLLKDQRSLDAIDTAERYANGEATDDGLSAAWIAACDAADAAARDAERAAAWAAWDAVAAADAVRTAAGDAARAAWNAVAAADAAAWAAAYAATTIAATTIAAADAAGAAREKQEAELRRICEERE